MFRIIIGIHIVSITHFHSHIHYISESMNTVYPRHGYVIRKKM